MQKPYVQPEETWLALKRIYLMKMKDDIEMIPFALAHFLLGRTNSHVLGKFDHRQSPIAYSDPRPMSEVAEFANDPILESQAEVIQHKD